MGTQDDVELAKNIARESFAIGKELYPDAPMQYHFAFANATASICTGKEGGYFGPNMRELLAVVIAVENGWVHELSADEVRKRIQEVCYGNITPAHALIFQRLHPKGDLPEDVEVAESILAAQSHGEVVTP